MLQLTTIIFLVSFFTLAVIHWIATQLYLYWNIPWLDVPVHAFGGMIVALGFFTLRDLGLFSNAWLRILPVTLLVLFVAILWEVFEAVFDLIEANYLIDTIIDLCMGVLGGIMGFFIGNNLRKLR